MIRVAQLSLQGKRPLNQDRTVIAPTDPQNGKIIAAVADGLGGMKDGEKAAQLAVETLQENADDLLLQMSQDFVRARQSLLNVYGQINDRIRAYSQAHAQLGSVGTTFVTLIASGSRYLVVNAGDSRCYAVNDSGVEQITIDHTVAEALLERGILTPQDYDSSPLRNQLTRSLGPGSQCDPDVFPGDDFGAIHSDCTFLLCSDGFYSKLSNTDLMVLSASSLDLDHALESLANISLDRHSSDNLSAVAIRFEATK